MFRKNKSLLLFLLPGLLLLLIFYVIPFFSGISYSVTDGSKANAFVGLKNYEALWQNKMFLLGLQHYMNNMFSRLDYQMVTATAYSFAVIVLALFAVLFILQRRAAQ